MVDIECSVQTVRANNVDVSACIKSRMHSGALALIQAGSRPKANNTKIQGCWGLGACLSWGYWCTRSVQHHFLQCKEKRGDSTTQIKLTQDKQKKKSGELYFLPKVNDTWWMTTC